MSRSPAQAPTTPRQVRPEAIIRQLSEDNANLKQRLLIAYDDLLVANEMNRQLQAELTAAKKEKSE